MDCLVLAEVKLIVAACSAKADHAIFQFSTARPLRSKGQKHSE